MTAHTSRAMTLVELMVVLSMGAVGLGVMVPAFGGQRSKNYLGHELSNLRVLMQVAFKYSEDDANGVLGPVHPQHSNFVFEGYAEYGGGPGTTFVNGWSQAFDPRTRPLNSYFYGLNGIQETTAPGDPNYFREFQCRGDDRGWQKWPGFSTSPTESEPNSYYFGDGTSFRMNNLSYGFSGGSFGIYGRRRHLIPAASMTLAFMEARAYQTIYTNDAWGSLVHGELKGWHDKVGYFVVTYSDGRAAQVDFGDGTYYQHLTGPSPYNQNLDVRGTWGRMDCLPGGAGPN